MKKTLKIVAIALGSILVLVTVLLMSLRIPAVQNYLKSHVVSYLEDKIKTKVELERVYIGFPNLLEIENFYIQGQKEDTLLFTGKLEVGLNMLQLINSKADITKIYLDDAQAQVVRYSDGGFNFDYILEAFTSDEKKQENESKPFVLSLDKIDLKNIRVRYIDWQNKSDLTVRFKDFSTQVESFDLEQNKYEIRYIDWDGLKLKLKQDLAQELAKKTEKTVDSLTAETRKPLQIGLKKIKLTNFDVDYGDQNTKTFANVKFQEFSTKINRLDLPKNEFDIKNILLKGANIQTRVYLPSSPSSTPNSKSSTQKDSPVQLLLGKLILDDVQLAYHNTASVPTSSGMDFNHLTFSKLDTEIRNFKMQDGRFEGSVNSAQIVEHRGLNIQKLNADFLYTEKQAFLKDLHLQTPHTLLRESVILEYESLQQLATNPGAVRISANLPNAKLGFSDILNLAPQLRYTAPFDKYPQAILNLDARLVGSINDLKIEKFNVSGIDRLKLRVTGRLRNTMKPDRLHYDLRIGELSSDAYTIKKMIPKGSMPSNINLPEYLRISGIAKGTTQVVTADLKMISTLGDADLYANVDLRKENREHYDVKAYLKNLHIGKIIQNRELGSIQGTFTARGVGFDPASAQVQVVGRIGDMSYKGYRYTEMNLDAELSAGNYQVKVNSRDSNARLDLIALGNYTEKKQALKLKGQVVKLDLHKLGFYSSPMTIAGKIDGDFYNLNPDQLNGQLQLKNFAISDGKEVFNLRDIALDILSTADQNRLVLESQIADFRMQGKYRITQIFGALQQTLNRYYQFQKPQNQSVIDSNQFLNFQAQIKDDDLIRKFIPELKSFETITLEGSYHADNQNIKLQGNIPALEYAENKIQGIELFLSNEGLPFSYAFSVKHIDNPNIALHRLNLSGDVWDNTVTYRLTTEDEKEQTQFLVSGNLKKIEDIIQISLQPQGLKLHYTDWQVSEDNRIEVHPQGILAHNFRLTNRESEILLASETNAPTSPLNIDIRNFKIEQILEMVKKDRLLAEGTINGQARVQDMTQNMRFSTDIVVSDFKFMGTPVGNLIAKVENKEAEVMDITMVLSEFQNDVTLKGVYNTKASQFSMDLNINKLQMQTLQGFSMGNISKAEGYLFGNMSIEGTTDATRILGQIDFKEVGFLVPQVGADFRKINDRLTFTSRGIEFDEFTVHDKDNNSMALDGTILTKNYRNFAFDLDLKAEDFKLVNAQKSSDAMMYGILELMADLQIRGDLDLPQVDGKLAVTDDTNFTFILPQDSPSLQEREGIVTFIDQDKIILNEEVKTDSLSTQSKIKGMDVNVNIELKKEAKLSIIVDKAAGDFVEIQGEAELTGGIDPSGKTTLVGIFQVEKGAYELSMSSVKRRFEIEKGSTITWTGEPTTATLAMTAVYKTQASPIDLIEQQSAGMSAAELNLYKQRMPFNTLLILSGELMKPVITFDITTDENNVAVPTSVMGTVKSKLAQLKNDEAERNKQVFALLLLNRFIGENPFQSEAGLSAGTMARQSVSKILSQQLNNLASNLIAGVDLTFDLEASEDYTSGKRNERTDLNVNLSKNLLNDRLKVSVGSNFGIEGDARQNEEMTNIAGDVTLDYKLSRDGRYMLRAYRTNQYQVALQGQVVETGIGFIITLDYNQFEEIFRKSKQKQKKSRKPKTSSF